MKTHYGNCDECKKRNVLICDYNNKYRVCLDCLEKSIFALTKHINDEEHGEKSNN